MGVQRTIPVQLADDVTMVVVADQVGPSLVADRAVDGRFAQVTASVERVSTDVLDAVRRARPTAATVELAFGLAVEEGRLVALFGKAKADASITVTLEWRGGGGGQAEDAPGSAVG